MGLSVSDLACLRSGRAVLRDLDFTVAEGRARPLRGPNGAGKTTLLRLLAGLISPASGDAVLDGASLRRAPEQFAEHVAYAGHLDALKPQLTIAENLRFWAALLAEGGARQGFDAAVAAFDLEPLLERPAHACSAGQKRRAGLARLLLGRRRLWLLDEPTVSLDKTAVGRLAAAIRGHCAEGGMALIATHLPLDLGAAEESPLELAPLDPRPVAGMAGSDPFLSGNWA